MTAARPTRAADRRGHIMVQTMVLGGIAAVLTYTLLGWTALSYRAGKSAVQRERSIQIAEAGIEYYRWHLAHAPADFQDGTGQPGPYLHDFRDRDGNVIGHFELDIAAPDVGNSEVTVRSSGRGSAAGSPTRQLAVSMTKPSFARYAVAANDFMRFGEGTEVNGPIHSNKGIRFDGLAHNLISSAVAAYDDPDHEGGMEFGVHTHRPPADPLPPAAVPSRPDVFRIGRQFPVAAIDFDGMTADFAAMRLEADADGFYRPSAGAHGYHVSLRTDGTFDLYRVTKLLGAPGGCTNSAGQDDWGTWSIENEHHVGNFPLPANGLIFLEDHIFVDGQIDGARVTIVAAFLPENPPFRKHIIVNENLLYTSHDGSDSVGLIAQGHIITGLASRNDLRIDAALIAKKGRVGRFYYPSGCSPYDRRNSLTLWGMIATAMRYGFAYTDGSGYAFRYINYDGSLFFRPPPSFPLTSEHYVTTFWREQ